MTMVHDQRTQHSNIVMFVGTTPRIGTTIAAISTAMMLAQAAPHLRIAYLCFNLKSSKVSRYLGLSDLHAGLSGLRADLKARSLTAEQLQTYCVRLKPTPNLYVLAGNRQREQAELYAPEDMEHLLDVAAQAFDICIVDCSAYWDNAATVITGWRAGLKYLVTMPILDAFQDDYRGWLVNTASLFDIAAEEFQLVLTQTGYSPDEYRLSEIQQAVGIPLAGSLPYDRQIAQDVQRGRLLDSLKLQQSFMKHATQLASKVAQHFNVDIPASEKRRVRLKLRIRGIKRPPKSAEEVNV